MRAANFLLRRPAHGATSISLLEFGRLSNDDRRETFLKDIRIRVNRSGAADDDTQRKFGKPFSGVASEIFLPGSQNRFRHFNRRCAANHGIAVARNSIMWLTVARAAERNKTVAGKSNCHPPSWRNWRKQKANLFFIRSTSHRRS